MRNRAGGILIEDNKVLLIHRIKKINKQSVEYYVIPGGGIEDGETLEDCIIRELKEEVGIEVKVISNQPVITLESEKENQYYMLIERISGVIGTGMGPEYTDLSYSDRGIYLPEMISVKDIVDENINLVPELIRKQFLEKVVNTSQNSLK